MKPMTHLVLAEPRTPIFRQAITAMTPGDTMILAGHAVSAGTCSDALSTVGELPDIQLGVVKQDLEERGLRDRLNHDALVVLDDTEFVEWLCRNRRVRSWL